MTKKLGRNFLILVFFMFLLNACSTDAGKTLFKDSQCEAPCWSQIMPGETTTLEAITILSKSSLVIPNTIRKTTANQYHYNDQIFWKFQGGWSGGISLQNNIVMEIRFEEILISLEELFDLYGEPGYIFISPRWGRDSYVHILYPEQGIWLWYYKNNKKDMIKIRPDDLVRKIFYVEPSLLLDLLREDSALYLKSKSKPLEELLVEWGGFTNITIP